MLNTRKIIDFKSKQDTNPSKLASAIAHNIGRADVRISCLGPEAVNATIKALIIAKKYTQNEDFTLIFDFFSIMETDQQAPENSLNVIQVLVSIKESTNDR